jgi:hypothetical protein
MQSPSFKKSVEFISQPPYLTFTTGQTKAFVGGLLYPSLCTRVLHYVLDTQDLQKYENVYKKVLA